MKKILKLLLLIVVCSSVFYIYQKTKNDTYNLINIGDELSISINSYGIKDYSPVSYYKNELLKTHKTVIKNIDNNFFDRASVLEYVEIGEKTYSVSNWENKAVIEIGRKILNDISIITGKQISDVL